MYCLMRVGTKFGISLINPSGKISPKDFGGFKELDRMIKGSDTYVENISGALQGIDQRQLKKKIKKLRKFMRIRNVSTCSFLTQIFRKKNFKLKIKLIVYQLCKEYFAILHTPSEQKSGIQYPQQILI